MNQLNYFKSKSFLSILFETFVERYWVVSKSFVDFWFHFLWIIMFKRICDPNYSRSNLIVLQDLWTWSKLCTCAGGILFALSDLLIGIDRFRFNMEYIQVGLSLLVTKDDIRKRVLLLSVQQIFIRRVLKLCVVSMSKKVVRHRWFPHQSKLTKKCIFKYRKKEFWFFLVLQTVFKYVKL